jgi:ABC-type nitrate/sulfonate/bicarbonate transport system substrate-binding protein
VSKILVPKGSPIASLADLKGKKIGSPQTTGAIGNLAVETTLKAHGVDPRDVTFVATPFPDEQTALARHQVDAVWATEPFVTVIKKTLGAHALADTMAGTMSAVMSFDTFPHRADHHPAAERSRGHAPVRLPAHQARHRPDAPARPGQLTRPANPANR